MRSLRQTAHGVTLNRFGVFSGTPLFYAPCMFPLPTRGFLGLIVALSVALHAEDFPPKVTVSRQPLAPAPWVASPPKEVALGAGRQLFVDDYLIEKTSLTRTFHLPEYYEGNPVLKGEKVWEKDHAAPFSDGVWWDAKVSQFKLFYWARGDIEGKGRSSTCLATSLDGLHWEKPALDVVPGTNIVLLEDPEMPRNSSTVWLDHAERDPARRWKMFQNLRHPQQPGQRGGHRLRASFSPDGIHWTSGPDSDLCPDRTTVFYNPFRQKWVASLRRADNVIGRFRAYWEGATIEEMFDWEKPPRRDVAVDWVSADELDPDRLDLPLRRTADRPWDLPPSQLYNLDCVAYESVLLGLFSICRGHQVPPLAKINEVCVGFSRDNFHWIRPDRRPFCPLNLNQPGWNAGNLQSAGGCCLVVADKLYFYVGAVPYESHFADPGNVGLAILRRDGFASMDGEGELLTRPLTFSGTHLFVNADCTRGELRAEVLDADGHVIAPFSAANCEVIREDTTKAEMRWKGAADLSAMQVKPVRLRFQVGHGHFYSFWITDDPAGASHGYVAAGGPGFDGATDQPAR